MQKLPLALDGPKNESSRILLIYVRGTGKGAVQQKLFLRLLSTEERRKRKHKDIGKAEL